MSRRPNTSETRLRDARVLNVAGLLLDRGARTNTVVRLTAVPDQAVRDVYHEKFGESPPRGPSKFSQGHYLSDPLIQLDASIAAGVFAHYLQHSPDSSRDRSAPSKDPLDYRSHRPSSEQVVPPGAPAQEVGYRRNSAMPRSAHHRNARAADWSFPPSHHPDMQPSEWLADLFYRSYDFYLTVVRQVHLLSPGMPFERFATLALALSKGSILQREHCTRCDLVYVTGINHADFEDRDTCPSCKIMNRRNCSVCMNYCYIDDGDISARRLPKCAQCAHGFGRDGFRPQLSVTSIARMQRSQQRRNFTAGYRQSSLEVPV